MCYTDDARPPLPPISGAAADTGDVTLKASDGNELMAHFARAENPSGAGMVVMPDVRGLHHFYKELALRFAEAGVHAVAFDYFGRTAGLTGRDEEFPYREHMEKIDFGQVTQDASAACDVLAGIDGVTSVFTVGFCFGGAMSWRQSASPSGYAGNIGFYGIPSRVVDVVPQMRAPLLCLAAGKDFTPVEEVQAFAGSVRAAGPGADVHVYPDAPHSFFDRTFAEHAAACADAWHQMLAFIDSHAT